MNCFVATLLLTKGEGPVLAHLYHVGITSVLRRCGIGKFGRLTGRTVVSPLSAPTHARGFAPRAPQRIFEEMKG